MGILLLMALEPRQGPCLLLMLEFGWCSRVYDVVSANLQHNLVNAIATQHDVARDVVC